MNIKKEQMRAQVLFISHYLLMKDESIYKLYKLTLFIQKFSLVILCTVCYTILIIMVLV